MTRPAFDADIAAARVVQAMRPLADAARATQEKRYLKSDLDFLGVGLNIFSAGGKVVPTPPAFISYTPASYLRPYDLFGRTGSQPPFPVPVSHAN